MTNTWYGFCFPLSICHTLIPLSFLLLNCSQVYWASWGLAWRNLAWCSSSPCSSCFSTSSLSSFWELLAASASLSCCRLWRSWWLSRVFFLLLVSCFQFLIYLLQVSVNIYFAVCLFSYYYELKNKKQTEGGDVELATAGKNNSYPVYTVKPVWPYIVLFRSLSLQGTFSSWNAINKCLNHIPQFLKRDQSGSQGVKR